MLAFLIQVKSVATSPVKSSAGAPMMTPSNSFGNLDAGHAAAVRATGEIGAVLRLAIVGADERLANPGHLRLRSPGPVVFGDEIVERPAAVHRAAAPVPRAVTAVA